MEVGQGRKETDMEGGRKICKTLPVFGHGQLQESVVFISKSVVEGKREPVAAAIGLTVEIVGDGKVQSHVWPEAI